MRFANKLEFGDKTREVSMTALRVVQRMKRDSIHSGRRPSGLCGAALLIAARLHEFNRSTVDIIKIVKVHESTLRKRLMEFGDTPSSALTLDEFMTVDLEEEQDPPAFKAARKKDRERLQRLENIDTEISELQAEIDKQLEDYKAGKLKKHKNVFFLESEDADRFIRKSNLDIIKHFVENSIDDPDERIQDSIDENNSEFITGLGPDIASMGLTNDRPNESKDRSNNNFENLSEEIYTNDMDDEELDRYILSEKEAQHKSALWNKINAEYLVQQKEKEAKRLKEKEEGKPEKKRRRTTSRKNKTPANTAGEAIEKMLQEKKISSKINYEVLKNLNIGSSSSTNNQQPNNTESTMTTDVSATVVTSEFDDVASFTKPMTVSSPSKIDNRAALLPKKSRFVKPNARRFQKVETMLQEKENEELNAEKEINSTEANISAMDPSMETVNENDDYLDEDTEPDATEMSVGQMLGHSCDDSNYYEVEYDGEDY